MSVDKVASRLDVACDRAILSEPVAFMPTPLCIDSRTQSVMGRRGRAVLSGFLIWVCFVLPGVLWLNHEPVVETRESPKLELQSDLWLSFIDVDYAAARLFQEAESFDIHYELMRDPTIQTAEDVHDEAVWEAQPGSTGSLGDMIELRWQEELLIPRPRLHAAGRLDYKLSPSFDFENKALKLRGLTIRVWVDF